MQYKKYNPEIGDSYFATSEKDNTTDDILKPPIGTIIIVFFAVSSFLVILITVILMVIYLYTKRWDRKLTNISELIKSNKASKSKIVGIAFTSWILNIYIFCLDTLALTTVINNAKKTSILVPDHLFVPLTYTVFSIGLLAILIMGVFCGLSIRSLCDCCEYPYCICSSCCPSKCSSPRSWYNCCFKDKEYLFLALSTLGPMLSLLFHIPYIAIAFLNDAYHASSIFVAYTIIAFILFGAVELTYGTCQRALNESKNHEVNLEKIVFEKSVKLTANNDSNKTINTVKIALNVTHNTVLKLEYSEIKQQQLKIDSIMLLPSEQQEGECNVFLDNLYTYNAQLTIKHDGNNPDQVKCKCTTEFKGDETSSIELNIKQTEQLEVTDFNKERKSIKLKEATLDIQGGKLLRLGLHCWPSCSKTNGGITCIFVPLIPLFVLILLALIVMVTAVLVTIPVHNAFSDAPNRLVGFYQSVVVFVGAYVLYRSFFKRKPTIETAVEDRMKHVDPKTKDGNEKWKQLSKEERVAEFYSRVVDIVANYNRKDTLAATKSAPPAMERREHSIV